MRGFVSTLLLLAKRFCLQVETDLFCLILVIIFGAFYLYELSYLFCLSSLV
jgi:hypothetical protein